MRTSWLLCTLMVVAAGSSQIDAAGFSLEEQPGRLIISYEGRPRATFVYRDDKILRPYFANLYAPGEIQVTRNHPPISGKDATDHDTMHPGLWLAFGDINGQDFWRNKGRIEHVRFTEQPKVKENSLAFGTECRLLATDGAPFSSLSNRFTLIQISNAWLLVWEASFFSNERDLVFGDQEEMGFGTRAATAITEKNGGVMTSSAGLKTAKKTWGQPADWCDYSGTVEGQALGITLMAAPVNFRPSWWHNRDYGLMVANPFGREAMKQGEKSMFTVKRGQSFRLLFGAAIHHGQVENPGTFYQEYLKTISTVSQR